MIHFNCTGCGKAYSVADGLAGRKAKCKNCGAAVLVPEKAQKPRDAQALPRPTTKPTASPAAAKKSPSTNDISSWLDEELGLSPAAADSATGTVPSETSRASSSAKKKPPVRTRRLIADANMLAAAFRDFPLIRIKKREGDPPDLYQIVYHVRGLVRGPEGKPVYRDGHIVEIQLTRDYPRQSPKCRMLTPVFHPNIEPSTICVGDHWTAGERLVDLVIRIGEMITYQAYNIKSPLDGDAAMWADQNPQYLPVDTRDLRPPNID